MAEDFCAIHDDTKVVGGPTCVCMHTSISRRLSKARFWSPIPEPNRAWLLVFYFSLQASQLLVYQSRDYHVYIPNTYQTRPVSCSKTGLKHTMHV